MVVSEDSKGPVVTVPVCSGLVRPPPVPRVGGGIVPRIVSTDSYTRWSRSRSAGPTRRVEVVNGRNIYTRPQNPKETESKGRVSLPILSRITS